MSVKNSEIRSGRKFGYGDYLGDRGDNFFDIPLYRQVNALGWSHSCPVIVNVVREYGAVWKKDHPGAGDKEVLDAGRLMTRARYAECNVVFKIITDAVAAAEASDLHKQLTTPTRRGHLEPDGEHPRNLVPDNHRYQMSPMGGIIGYALPRVVIEEMGRGEGNKDRSQERILKALEIVDETARESDTPVELLVKLSERVVENHAEPKAVLSHLLSRGVLIEENCQGQYQEIVAGMKKWAPILYETYEKMGSKERQELEVVDMRIIDGNEVTMEQFTFRGITQKVKYQGSGEVTKGVMCDVYKFDGDESKDLGVIRIEKGFRTPIQLVEIEEGITIEGYVSGKGVLTVIRKDGRKDKYPAEDMISFVIEVNQGDRMQWEADKESDLKVYELCYPPFEEGRFTNVGYGWLTS